uniref:POLX_2 protein n=1 Tax=Fopius arisanus TaxID=64838 RepID=A0A0C9QGV1_9HYME
MNSSYMKLLKDVLATGVKYVESSKINPCDSCAKGKQHREPFHPSLRRSKKVLQLIHADVCGPMEYSVRGDSDNDVYQLAEEDEDLKHVPEVRVEEGEIPLRRSSRPPKPIVREDFITYLSYDKHSSDPETLEEALNSPEKEKRLKAMMNEKKLLDTKWVFRTKKNSSGEIERYKARLVVRGYRQQAGIDCCLYA